MNTAGFLQRIFGGCRQHKQQWFIRRASKKLKLDDTQQNQLTAFIDQFQRDRGDIEQTRNNSLNRVLSLLLQTGSDENTTAREQLKSVMQDSLLSMQQSVNSMVDNFADFIDNLNPQQRQQLYQYVGHQSHRHCYH